MIYTTKNTASADELEAVLGTIPGIEVLASSISDRGPIHFLFLVDETLEGWSALRLLRTVTQKECFDGSERMAHLSLADSNIDDPDFQLMWQLECCPVCGLTPGAILEALEAQGYGPSDQEGGS
jgi:hypothetical protein